MADLEERLTSVLQDGASAAPSAIGLAAAARARARAKRRTRLAGAAVVAVLGVGVPVGLLSTQGSGGDGDGDPGPADGPVAVDTNGVDEPGLPNGYHYESWHDVTIEVPNTWGYGTLDQWCTDGASPAPVVQRPGVSTLVACTPATGYGVSFAPREGGEVQWPVAQQHSGGWPDGAFVGATTVGDVVVTVVARESTVAGYVLESAAANAAIDPQGCPIDTASDPVVPGDAMTVCRYDAGGRLEQSELLTGADVADVESALADAPPTSSRVCDAEPGQTVRLASIGQDAQLDLVCGTLFVHGEARELTSDVLYWALSPGWSGSLPGGVPLPSELRKP